MPEREAAKDSEGAVEELASVDVLAEEVAGGPAGLALSGARLAARAGAGAMLPPGRGGSVAIARRMLALQHASGNAAAKRMLARRFEPAVAPAGTAAELAAWVLKRATGPGRIVRGQDRIAVIAGGRVTLFTTDDPPAERRSFLAGERLPRPGVWSVFGKDGAVGGPLGLLDGRDWMNAGGPMIQARELVNEVDEAGWREALPGFPGQTWIVVPGAAPLEPVTPGPAPTTPAPKDWAPEQVRRARRVLDPTDTTPGPRPEDLVPWQRKEDGKWFVNVWSKGDHRPLELDPKQTDDELRRRIQESVRDMEADADPRRSVRVKGSTPGDPVLDVKRRPGELAIPAGTPFDPAGGMKPNSPPFPARLVSHGQEGLAGNEDYESTVTGASVSFTMDLDFAAVTSGFWEEFGARWQVIAYRWELLDISKLRLDQVKGALGRPDSDIKADIARLRKRLGEEATDAGRENLKQELDRLEKEVERRGQEADSGVSRAMARDVAATWEDTKADLSNLSAWITGYFAVVAVSDIVQLVGTPLQAGFTLAASPMSDASIGFNNAGVFLLRCFAQPVITPEDVKRIQERGDAPVIRPPSVAYLPVKVTDIHERATEVNDAELKAIDDLRRQLANPPPPFTREDVEARLKEAEAGLEANTVGSIDLAIGRAESQLKLAQTWREAEYLGKKPEERSDELRTWKAMIEISGTRFADYEQRMRDDIVRLKKARERVQGYGLDGITGNVFRPRVTLVSEEDGRVYPIVGHLVQVATSGDDYTWRVVDASSDDTRDTYEGSGKTHSAAITAAFERFAAKCDYGRGTIAIGLPLAQLQRQTGETIKVPSELRAAPGFGKRFLTRLQNLATAAEVAALFVAGPIGVAIGVAGGLAGAAVAIHSLIRRAERGQSLLTFEAGMDVLAVVGSVAMMGGAAAQLKGVANLSRRARFVAGGLHVFGTGMLRGQVVFIPMALYTQLEAIEKQERTELDAAAEAGTTAHVDRTKYKVRRLEALATFVKSGLVTVRMMQMAENPEAGWNPLKGRPGPAVQAVVDPEAPMKPLNALRHALRDLANLIKKRGVTNAERQKIIESLRTPTGASRGALEGFLPKTVLAENQRAVRKVRENLTASNPDVIVGMERGGAFLADVLAEGDPTLGAKVRKMAVHKAKPRPGGAKAKTKFEGPAQLAEFDALIEPGKPRKIAIVDYYMGGTTAGELRDMLIKRYAGKPGYEGVTFEIHWIRETLGFSDAGGTLKGARSSPAVGEKGYGMFSQTHEPVTLALGDDMTIIMNPGTEQPLHVFDDNGNITQTIRPRGGSTSRDALIDLLNRPPQ